MLAAAAGGGVCAIKKCVTWWQALELCMFSCCGLVLFVKKETFEKNS